MMCLGSSITDWLSVVAYWVSAVAFIATAVGAWKAYSASRKTLEYTRQELDVAKENLKIATRDLAVSDMTKEMVEIMLVLFHYPLIVRVIFLGAEKISGPHLVPPNPQDINEMRPKGFRAMYSADMYYHALNTLLLYDMIKVRDNVYTLTDVGQLMFGKLWVEMPYEEDFRKMYSYLMRGT